jgi:hypothetical protein
MSDDVQGGPGEGTAAGEPGSAWARAPRDAGLAGSDSDDVDFAGEHANVTLADEPSGRWPLWRESDSPKGLAGAD